MVIRQGPHGINAFAVSVLWLSDKVLIILMHLQYQYYGYQTMSSSY